MFAAALQSLHAQFSVFSTTQLSLSSAHKQAPSHRQSGGMATVAPSNSAYTANCTQIHPKAAAALHAKLSQDVLTSSGFPVTLTPDEKVFIVDTGASYTITSHIDDFLRPPSPLPSINMQGIGAGLVVEGVGHARYTFHADDGTFVDIILQNVLYVPACCIRLLCPRDLATTTGHEGDGFFSASSVSHLVCYGYKISVPYHAETGLPIILTASGIKAFTAFCNASQKDYSSSPPKVTFQLMSPSGSRINLTPAQRLKLILHKCCNHVGMDTLNSWIRKGHFNVDPVIARSLDPLCLACQFGKAKRRSHRSDIGSITQHHRVPGAGVSADQLEAGCPGKMMTTHGLPTYLHRCSIVTVTCGWTTTLDIFS